MIKSSHSKTILQIVPHTTYSGIELSARDIIIGLQSRGYNVIVISGSIVLEDYFQSRGIKHYAMDIHSGNFFTILRNAAKIINIIKHDNIDIIHARSRAPAWSCYIAAIRTKKPFITTFHAIYDNSNFMKRYYNSIMARGQRVTAISQFIKAYIEKNYLIDNDRVRVIRRGIDTSYFNIDLVDDKIKTRYKEKYFVADVPVILLPATLVHWKGQMLVLNALDKIRDLDFYCIFVGDLSKNLDYTADIRAKVTDLKFQSKVKIFSQEPDMRSLYAISDIVLSASTAPDAFNRSIVEAQSMENIVISTNIGSSSEIVNKDNGFLLHTIDADSLANQIRYVLSNLASKQLKVMKKNARQSAIAQYDLKHMIDETAAVYKEMTE